MASIFTQIINREVNAYIVDEDDNNIAFLDINPVNDGHTIVIPKIEVDNILDLDDNIYTDLFIFAKKVAKNIFIKFDCVKVSISVIGVEVQHAHIHLIPIMKVSDLNFNNKKANCDEIYFTNILNKLNS